MLIEKRKKDYNFENLDTLSLKEGFEENIINKMKEIIKEAKNDEFKNRIFNFIVESVETFKNNQDKYLKELNLIAEQVKVNFKELVKEKVGDTKDVKKFMEKDDNVEKIIENNTSSEKEIVNTIPMKKRKKRKN